MAFSFVSSAQNADSTQNAFSLRQCIEYALSHHPLLKQAQINEEITNASNAIDLSARYPQINGNGTLTHYLQLPTIFTDQNGNPSTTHTGVRNTFIPGVSVSQAIFSPALIYATKVTTLYSEQARQITDSTKINLVVTVSKSFYNLLLTFQEIGVLKEDTVRLGQSLRDAYHQYVGGIVDETDYEQATISLNNSVAELNQANENIAPQYASLKQAMGYPAEQQFNLVYDSTEMMQEIAADTTKALNYNKRIEFQELNTRKDIQHKLTEYYHLAAWPTISGIFNYNYEFQNSAFSKLFSTSFPYSFVGLTFSIPIFTGFNRVENARRSNLMEQSLDWSLQNLRASIYSEYKAALASYKSNMFNLQTTKTNRDLARRVYFVVTLQYKEGIVPYLNVITAETNLITSEINYQNALFQVLSSKVDLERAMGDVEW